MEFRGKFFENDDYLLKKWGLEPNGRVQRTIDGLCITYMQEFTPFQSGILEAAPIIVEPGHIVQDTPYARYQYYGELYVDPKTQKGAFYKESYGFWSRPNVNKVPSGKPLHYNTKAHPKAGPKWFERMKVEYKDDIIRQAQRVANEVK